MLECLLDSMQAMMDLKSKKLGDAISMLSIISNKDRAQTARVGSSRPAVASKFGNRNNNQ